MKKAILLLILVLPISINGQMLTDILSGYTVSKIPTDQQIVGAKWSSIFGATTQGLSADQVIISNSLNQYSLTSNNSKQLGLGLLSMLGLTGYSSNSFEVIFNDLKVHSARNIYDLPLVKGEKVVFSSIGVGSFDLVFLKELDAIVKAKIPLKNLNIDAEADLGSQKRITVSGANLFIAHQILQIDKVESKTKTKKLKNGFEVKDIFGYDVSFNVNELVNYATEKTVEEIGQTAYDNLQGMGLYIQKYSNGKDIRLSILSTSRGTSNKGIFKKKLDLCYCKAFGDVDGKLFLINSFNTGEKMTFDYLYLDNFWIDMVKGGGIYFLQPSNNSKISVISKTYKMTNVTN